MDHLDLLQSNEAASDHLLKIGKKSIHLFLAINDPDDHRQIVNAQVVEVGTGFRIEVASATSG